MSLYSYHLVWRTKDQTFTEIPQTAEYTHVVFTRAEAEAMQSVIDEAAWKTEPHLTERIRRLFDIRVSINTSKAPT